jgi:hypothetical protein
MSPPGGVLGVFQGGKDQGGRRKLFEERILLETPIREKEKGSGVTLVKLHHVIRSGSNDENRAAQGAPTPVPLRGRE